MKERSLSVKVKIANIEIPVKSLSMTIGMGGLRGTIVIPPSILISRDEAIAGLSNAPIAIFVDDEVVTRRSKGLVLLTTGIVTGVRQRTTTTGSIIELTFVDEIDPLKRFIMMMGPMRWTTLGSESSTTVGKNMVLNFEMTVGKDKFKDPLRKMIHYACHGWFGKVSPLNNAVEYTPINLSGNWEKDFKQFQANLDALKKKLQVNKLTNFATISRRWFIMYLESQMLYCPHGEADRIINMIPGKFAEKMVENVELGKLISNGTDSSLYTSLAYIIGNMLNEISATIVKMPYPRFINTGKIGLKDFASIPSALKTPFPSFNYIKSEFLNGVEFARSLSPYTHGGYISKILEFIPPDKGGVDAGIAKSHINDVMSDVGLKTIITSGPNLFQLQSNPILNLTYESNSDASLPTALGEEQIENAYYASGRADATLFYGFVMPGFPVLFEVKYSGMENLFFGRTMNINYTWDSSGKFTQTLGISSIIPKSSDFLANWSPTIQKYNGYKDVINPMIKFGLIHGNLNEAKYRTLRNYIEFVRKQNENTLFSVPPQEYQLVSEDDYNKIFEQRISKHWPVEIHQDFLKILEEYYEHFYEII